MGQLAHQDHGDEREDERAWGTYHHFKSLTIGMGIPSQVVTQSMMSNQFALANIAIKGKANFCSMLFMTLPWKGKQSRVMCCKHSFRSPSSPEKGYETLKKRLTELHSIGQCARALNVPKTSLWSYLVHHLEIKRVELGCVTCVRPSDLRAYIDQRERALKSGRMETNRRNIASASKKLNERG